MAVQEEQKRAIWQILQFLPDDVALYVHEVIGILCVQRKLIASYEELESEIHVKDVE